MADQDKRPRDREDKGEYRPSMFSNVFRGFYDRFRNVPLRHFDIFIGLCVAAIVVVIVVGILQGRGIL